MPIRRLLACALGCATIATAAPAAAEPALWAVRDADSTVYLFGTVHALKEASWWTPKLEAALSASQELWVEVGDAADPARMGAEILPVVQKLGLDPTTPLSTRLTPAERESLASAAAAVGLKPEQLEPMKPWLAALTFSTVPMIRAGYDPNLGVDTFVAKMAVREGKPVKGFETGEQQLGYLANLPLEAQLEMLRQTLKEIASAPQLLDEMAAAWSAGDTAGLERMVDADMKDEGPELYRALIVRRNQAWANAIAERMKGKGISFVAVGAAHLLGPDSVQSLLAARGLTSVRQ